LPENTGIEINRRLKETLAQRQVLRIENSSFKPSAVLVPIYFQGDCHYVVFTRRTELVRYHKGEISFPGGGYHPQDSSLETTALRESYEEIGLAPGDVEVLGELDDIITLKSDYIITPFVGSIQPGYQFRMSDIECAEIIQIPMTALLDEGCYREEPILVKDGKAFQPYVYYYQKYKIIGATATILKQFLAIYALVIGQA
jgi:8-oxo-dGTP pyrophosphatase MutT (NUDIX family)